MSDIVEYHLRRNGSLWVHLQSGEVREATDSEWLYLWRKNPELTLRLAA